MCTGSIIDVFHVCLVSEIVVAHDLVLVHVEEATLNDDCRPYCDDRVHGRYDGDVPSFLSFEVESHPHQRPSHTALHRPPWARIPLCNGEYARDPLCLQTLQEQLAPDLAQPWVPS